LTTGARLWRRRRASQRQESGFCSAQHGACVADSGATGSAELDPIEERHSALRAEHGAHSLHADNGKTPCGRILRLCSPRFNHAWRGPAEFPPRTPSSAHAGGKRTSRGSCLPWPCIHLARQGGRSRCASMRPLSRGARCVVLRNRVYDQGTGAQASSRIFTVTKSPTGTVLAFHPKASLEGIAAKRLIRRESVDQARTSGDRLLGVWRRPR